MPGICFTGHAILHSRRGVFGKTALTISPSSEMDGGGPRALVGGFLVGSTRNNWLGEPVHSRSLWERRPGALVIGTSDLLNAFGLIDGGERHPFLFPSRKKWRR